MGAQLRCWPGALAFIVHPGPWHGTMVEVLRAAPATTFLLPDGQGHVGCAPGTWVVKSLGKPFSCPRGLTHETAERVDGHYGVCRDDQLRPIQPPPAADTTDTPAAVDAPALVD